MELIHAGELTPGKMTIIWGIQNSETGAVLGGYGNNQREAQQKFKDNLLSNGWTEDQISDLVQGEEGWLL